jgi:hypothetical protein
MSGVFEGRFRQGTDLPELRRTDRRGLGGQKGRDHVTTVQETSKRLKAQMLLASLSLAVGIVWAILAANASEPTSLAFPTSLFVGGLVWYAITRFRIWWHHE